MTYALELHGAESFKSVLRNIPRETRSHMIPALRQAGELTLADARGRADWSDRIPPAMYLAFLWGPKTAGIWIRVHTGQAPHARPYEGIAGGMIGVGSFRHPVFGNFDVWVEQETRPFLVPAARAQGPTTVRLAREALHAAVMAA